MLRMHEWLFRLRLRASIDYATRDRIRTLLINALYVLFYLVVIIGALIVVTWNDQRMEARATEARLQHQAATTQQQLIDCMNGKSTGLYYKKPTGQMVFLVCDPAWELPV